MRRFLKTPETICQIYLGSIFTLFFYGVGTYGALFKNTMTPWFWYSLAALFSIATFIDIWLYRKKLK